MRSSSRSIFASSSLSFASTRERTSTNCSTTSGTGESGIGKETKVSMICCTVRRWTRSCSVTSARRSGRVPPSSSSNSEKSSVGRRSLLALGVVHLVTPGLGKSGRRLTSWTASCGPPPTRAACEGTAARVSNKLSDVFHVFVEQTQLGVSRATSMVARWGFATGQKRVNC